MIIRLLITLIFQSTMVSQSTVSGNAPDGESVAIVFDSGGKNGVEHRKRDILQINATGTVDLGPLNLRYQLWLITIPMRAIVCQFTICLTQSVFRSLSVRLR